MTNLLKIEESIVDKIPFKPGRTNKQWQATVKRRFKAAGYRFIRALKTVGGTCLTCGEDGRCIGYHILGGGE